MKIIGLVLLLALNFACGPKAFIRGDYDKDVTSENLLNDRWSETDMQKAVNTLVNSLVNHRSIAAAKKMPIVMITSLKNKTSEHIDTQNIMDMVRVELMNKGRVGFIDKEAREDIQKEYDYQASGTTARKTQKRTGHQVGADFILNGRLDSIVQEVGNEKTVYYKLTLNLTNLESGVIMWSNHKQIRKRYDKKRVGL